jgi:hypothetical protein
LLISHLNFCRSCCRSSLTLSRSFTCAPCPKRFTKWNVDEVPSWRQTWSWIFGLPSGDIFCAETIGCCQQRSLRNNNILLFTNKSSSHSLTTVNLLWFTPCPTTFNFTLKH